MWAILEINCWKTGPILDNKCLIWIRVSGEMKEDWVSLDIDPGGVLRLRGQPNGPVSVVDDVDDDDVAGGGNVDEDDERDVDDVVGPPAGPVCPPCGGDRLIGDVYPKVWVSEDVVMGLGRGTAWGGS